MSLKTHKFKYFNRTGFIFTRVFTVSRIRVYAFLFIEKSETPSFQHNIVIMIH